MARLRCRVGGPVGPAGTVSLSLASTPRSVSVAPADHQTRLRDSVRPGVPLSSGASGSLQSRPSMPCLACGNRSPAGEGCDRTGPSSRYEVGVLQPLLHCAQEKRWVTTDLGSASFVPCTAQDAVQDVDAETHFRVRPSPRLVCSIDLKDAYIHVLILPWHRPFLQFAFERRAYQYKVLPFGLSLSPRVFTKVVEAALVPLRERGVRILNYLDDWLILAQSREQLCAHKDLVLRHLSQLGLRVSWVKSKLVPTQRISFLGMELDSVNQTARLTQKRAQSVLNCLKTLSGRMAVPLKLFQSSSSSSSSRYLFVTYTIIPSTISSEMQGFV